MWDKMKRTLDDVFSGGDWSGAAGQDNATIAPAALRFGNGPTPDILDLLREQRVPTSFFLSGSRADRPHKTSSYPGFGPDRVPPEPFFVHHRLAGPHLPSFWTQPCFVRLPDGGGHHMLRVYRLSRDEGMDCVLVRWIRSAGADPLPDGDGPELDLVQRCRQAVEGGFADGRIAGTLILLIDDPMETPLAVRVAPLLLREMLAGTRQRQWALIGIGAPAPASATAAIPVPA